MRKKKGILKSIFTAILAVTFIITCNSIYAELTGITITSLVPPSPGAGDLVTVNFNYTLAGQLWNNNHFCAAVSTFSTIQGGSTAGQTFKTIEGNQNVGGTGLGAPTFAGGWDMSDGDGSTTSRSGSFTFNIPSSYEGGTYYVVVGGKVDYLDLGSAFPVAQDFIQFNIPLPPADASITAKTAEGSMVQPGDMVLYSIDYTVINSTNFVIVDTLPTWCTLIEQSSGGTSTGTTPGSVLTWDMGNVTTRITDTVWYLVRVDALTPPGTVISNTAHWSMDEIPAGGDSPAETVTVGESFELVKSQSVSSANIGDNVTYSFDFTISGMSLKYYDSYDSGSGSMANYTSTGGTWTNPIVGGEGYLRGDGGTGYPHFVRNQPTDFCEGMLVVDMYIEPGVNNDALIAFYDEGVPNGRAYGAGISEDGIPGSIYVQESNPTWYDPAGVPGMTSGAVSISNGVWYTVKVMVSVVTGGDVNIKVKVWRRGDPEPPAGTWHIDWTDSTPIIGCATTYGKVALQAHPENLNRYDNLKILQSSLAAADSELYDTVPAEITYIGGTSTDGTHTGASFSSGMVKWDFPGQVDDYTGHIEWWGTINSCGTIYNRGSFKPNSAAPPIDSNTTTLNVTCPESPTITPTYTWSETPTLSSTPSFTFTATPTLTPTPSATMTSTPVIPIFSLTKSANPTQATIGETITYTIHYRNTGLPSSSGIVIWDTLPLTHDYVNSTGGDSSSYDPGTRLVTWLIAGPVASGAQGDVFLEAVIGAGAQKDEHISNQASLTTSELMPFSMSYTSNITDVLVVIPDLDLFDIINYPNPAVDDTVFVFNLTVASDVTIKIFTLSGELIRTYDPSEVIANLVAQADIRAGENRMRWDGDNDHMQRVASGIYFVKIYAESRYSDETDFSIYKFAVMR